MPVYCFGVLVECWCGFEYTHPHPRLRHHGPPLSLGGPATTAVAMRGCATAARIARAVAIRGGVLAHCCRWCVGCVSRVYASAPATTARHTRCAGALARARALAHAVMHVCLFACVFTRASAVAVSLLPFWSVDVSAVCLGSGVGARVCAHEFHNARARVRRRRRRRQRRRRRRLRRPVAAAADMGAHVIRTFPPAPRA